MKCKGCRQPIAGKDYKKVADWVFCLNCFEKLMQKPRPAEGPCPPSTAGPDSQAAGQDVRPKEQTASCSLCGIPLEKDAAARIGPWTFCAACHARLTYRPPQDSGSPDKRVDNRNGKADSDEAEKQPPSKDEFRKKMTKLVRCRQCGRQILEAASKRVENQPYCPDCFYAEYR